MQHLQKQGPRLRRSGVYTLLLPFWSSSPSPHPLQSLLAPLCYHRPCCLSFGDESEPGMTARTLDGQKIRDQIFAELSDEVRLLTAAGIRPGLAAGRVRAKPPSQLLLQSTIAACPQ